MLIFSVDSSFTPLLSYTLALHSPVPRSFWLGGKGLGLDYSTADTATSSFNTNQTLKWTIPKQMREKCVLQYLLDAISDTATATT